MFVFQKMVAELSRTVSSVTPEMIGAFKVVKEKPAPELSLVPTLLEGSVDFTLKRYVVEAVSPVIVTLWLVSKAVEEAVEPKAVEGEME